MVGLSNSVAIDVAGRAAIEPGAIGLSARRVEDYRLLTGQGCFVDDMRAPGTVHAVLIRSPHASARILAINVDQARNAPGVVSVLTGDDYAADGLGDIPCVSIPPNVMGNRWFRT